jgi:hypothetical protein
MRNLKDQIKGEQDDDPFGGPWVCPYCGQEVHCKMAAGCDEWVDICLDHGIIEGQAIRRADYEGEEDR